MPGKVSTAERVRRAGQRIRDLARPRRKHWERKDTMPKAAPAQQELVRVEQQVPTQIIGPFVSTANTWPTWNNTWTITTGSSSGTACNIITDYQDTWGGWCDTGTGGTSITASAWTTWNNTITVAHYPGRAGAYIAPLVVAETEEEKRTREELSRRYREEQAARDREARIAKLRAKKLLVDHLNPQQKDEYERRGFFHLYTNKGRKYRIEQGTHGNVKLIDETGTELGRYCSQPSGVPVEDSMLAQKLYLEIDEDEFVSRANFTPLAAQARQLLDYRGQPLRAAA